MRKGNRILLWLFVSVLVIVITGLLTLSVYTGGMVSNETTVDAPYLPPIAPLESLEAVDRILEKMQLGNIAFNVPTAMNLRDTASIQLMLSLVTPIEELKKTIEAAGLKEGARIQVSDRMEARLSGWGFAITAVTPEVQAISRQILECELLP